MIGLEMSNDSNSKLARHFFEIINSSNTRDFVKGHQNSTYKYEIRNKGFWISKVRFLGFNLFFLAAI